MARVDALRVLAQQALGQYARAAGHQAAAHHLDSALPHAVGHEKAPQPVGVVDGEPPLGVENDDDVLARLELLRTIGYRV